ncbi:cysteine dioxygenase family protein [Actinoplanes sp. NPDC051411]|uniref:cysteine dioxygenase n=1 Tax=Actinoplanes sp. NPDC051411 TaxID=3155522 RepID=UPI0034428EE1
MTAVDVRLDHLAIAARYAAAPGQWPVAPRFNPVDRWYHRLTVAEDHEVWLLTWLPGQGTDLHDHGGSSGAFLVVAGTLTEETVAPGKLTGDTIGGGTLTGKTVTGGTLTADTIGGGTLTGKTVTGGTLTADTIGAGTLTADTLTAATLTGKTVTAGTPTRQTGDERPRAVARELSAGDGRRFGPRHIHRVTNRSTRPAISIHVYGPALTTMTRYRLTAAGLEIRTVEAAGAQW